MTSRSETGRRKVAVLSGPTAAGKTEVSLRIAAELDAEIILADALCVYRGMDIGTAKPTAGQRSRLPHHCIDLVEPSVEFSVADYQSAARAAISDVHASGRLPLVVGGSGLYVRAATDSVDFAVPPDPGRRARLEAMPPADLVALLHELDPGRAVEIDLENPRRVLRAVERGLDGSPVRPEGWSDRSSPFDVAYAVLAPGDRGSLYEEIDARVDRMLASGWLDEVRDLLDTYGELSRTANAAIGYAELRLVLRGELEIADAKLTIRRRTRAFARRQLTWFRREPRAHWFEASGDTHTEERLIEFLSGSDVEGGH